MRLTDPPLHAAAFAAGPLVVGLTLSAIAIGAAFSAGAIAFTTFILPMVILMSIGGLASFGLFAGLGAMFVLPQLVFSALSLVSCSAILLQSLVSAACTRVAVSLCARACLQLASSLRPCQRPTYSFTPCVGISRTFIAACAVYAACRLLLAAGWRWDGAASIGCCANSRQIRVNAEYTDQDLLLKTLCISSSVSLFALAAAAPMLPLLSLCLC